MFQIFFLLGLLSLGLAVPDVVRIGGLFPMFESEASNYSKSDSGVQRIHAFIMAIKEINSDSSILPDTTIKFALGDSKRDQGEVSICNFSFSTKF